MNMLYDEECLKFRHKDFEKSYDLMAKEKHVILGMNWCYIYINRYVQVSEGRETNVLVCFVLFT